METQWISVNDRLPETMDEVLIWGTYYDSPIQAYYNRRLNLWMGSEETTYMMEDCSPRDRKISGQKEITHWTPLPKPPQQ